MAPVRGDAGRWPPAFPPPWAEAWGDDPHGLWAEFSVGGVVQRMRWIEPGEFWMGSPDEEPERSSDEGPRHRVRISRGFWLADTTCTQALWGAVVGGENPSHFRDDEQLPVEHVSWDDVSGFLQRLQAGLPEGTQAVLPTEAQWEYACRAGQDKHPFNVGPVVTRALANFNPDYPQFDEAKLGRRLQTVPVKAFAANAWGLHQMHGNVWEWCADGFRDYAETARGGVAIADPEGPVSQEQDAHRAVRGGAFDFPARRLRSAVRSHVGRGDRYLILGFRLALRS